MTDSLRDKIDVLQAQTERHIREIDSNLREARPANGSWTEDDIERWLHPTLHLLLGAVSSVDQRVRNLEDLLLRALESSDTASRVAHTSYETDHERQELEAGAAALEAHLDQIQALANAKGPVSAVERSNIALMLKRMTDQIVRLDNEIRVMQGRPQSPPVRIIPSN